MNPTWRALPPFFDTMHARLGDDLEASLRGETFADADPARVIDRLSSLGVFRLLRTCDSVRALCVAREILAYRSPLADAIFAAHGLAACVLVSADAERWRGQLQDAAAGRIVGGFAATEPDAGSDLGAMRATARFAGDAWALDGHKTFVSNVGIATFFIVFASVDPTLGSQGISAFFVDARDPGVDLAAFQSIDGHPLGQIVLRGARGELVGEMGHGMRWAIGALDVFRTTAGAAAVGMAQRAFDEAIRHTNRRAQFGQLLSTFQLVQADLADMATDLEAARLLVARAAWAKDQACAGPTDVAMAKMFATEAAQRIVDRALQLHGGLGVIRDGVVERLYRSVRSLRIHEGTTEIQKLRIGQALVQQAKTDGR